MIFNKLIVHKNIKVNYSKLNRRCILLSISSIRTVSKWVLQEFIFLGSVYIIFLSLLSFIVIWLIFIRRVIVLISLYSIFYRLWSLFEQCWVRIVFVVWIFLSQCRTILKWITALYCSLYRNNSNKKWDVILEILKFFIVI